jgi:tRNA G18 (ribose-2'-O)-methylase SpoU|tara:strand:+ start:1053 stop:1661 length:609 start_codon:yes stop_codon:yes gene_type:complete
VVDFAKFQKFSVSFTVVYYTRLKIELFMRKLRNNELGRISVSTFKKATKTPIIVVLDNIRSLNNVGSVFRTSDAFLIEKIYLCGITAIPPNREIHKTALGATESVDWEHKQDTLALVKKLKSEGIVVAAIEQAENSIMLDKFSLESNKKIAIVFGNEVKGVQQEVVSESDYCVEIPQKGTKHSLNISVSCGVVLWDLYQKIQ